MEETNERPVALITGGATGVGAAAAEMLAGRGYDLALGFSRSRSAAEVTVDRLTGVGARALALQGDVAEDADCRRLVAETVARFGRLDALVNSAATTRFAPLDDMEAQGAKDFVDVYLVNVVGPWQMARAAAPFLRQSPNGAVVNVSSIAGLNGNGSSAPYIASKGALNTLTLTLARLLAPEVRVNAVLPGLIDTRWLADGLGDDAFARVKSDFASASALQQVCTPADIAGTIVFLLAEARRMTGQLVTVDAGFLLGRPARVAR